MTKELRVFLIVSHELIVNKLVMNFTYVCRSIYQYKEYPSNLIPGYDEPTTAFCNVTTHECIAGPMAPTTVQSGIAKQLDEDHALIVGGKLSTNAFFMNTW